MCTRLGRPYIILPVILGVVALESVGVLHACDYFSRRFLARYHDFLGAFPLAVISFA